MRVDLIREISEMSNMIEICKLHMIVGQFHFIFFTFRETKLSILHNMTNIHKFSGKSCCFIKCLCPAIIGQIGLASRRRMRLHFGVLQE